MKRSIRRHHRERLLKERKKRLWWISDYFSITDKFNYVANTPCRCSCNMCGNPRKYFGKITKQEINSLLNFMEQCKESDIYTQLRSNNISSQE